MREQLDHLIQRFADRPGEIAILIQSKTASDVSVSLNADRQIASASVIKAAIACTAADLAARGDLDLQSTLARRDLNDTFYCSILHAFDDTDEITLKTLIGLMLIVSDNPATTAVIDAVGMNAVNDWCAANGMADTNLSVGFDDDSLGAPLRANLTTANDCLALLKLIDTRPDYAFIKRMLANNLRNERIPKRLPDDAVVTHKTGTLAGLIHDIAIVDSPVANYYLVVLADGLDDEVAFANDLSVFSEAVYALMSA